MKLSQSQAAKAAGVSRTQIGRAVKSGRVSVEKLETGDVLIDSSEVLRVWPQADLDRARVQRDNVPRTPHRDSTPSNRTGELNTLRELVQVLKRDQETRAIERDRERGEAVHREARAWAERDRLLLEIETLKRQLPPPPSERQLTPAPTPEPPPTAPPKPPERKGLWAWLMGK